jgi:hypothetical protein
MREISDLKTNPPEGIRILTSDDNILDLTGIIEGPGKGILAPILDPALIPL